jgi:predicted signal transduction protein with EAL and GGDEF domain
VDLGDAAPIIGASIGFAMSGADTTTSDELLRNADIAMYAAKAGGRGQIVAFRPDLLETASGAQLSSPRCSAARRRATSSSSRSSPS